MILIVDDRQENILPLKKILELHSFETDSADSGEMALKKVLKKTYSLIILDVQMPGMDGFEVAEAISGYSKAKDTPIIFLSAVSREKKFITQGYSSGGIDYITKPVDPDILLLKVKTFHRLYEQQLELKTIQQSLRSEIETRKQAEKALVGRMQEMQLILESMPLIAFSIARSGDIEFVNGHWYQYSDDPSKFPEVHADDEHECRRWEAHFADGKEFVGEMRLRNVKTSEFIYFMVKIVPIIQNGAIMRWVGTFNDIHQQKLDNEVLEQKVNQRTAELLAKNNELEATNHELQQFSWVVSHDLKEPLRKIQTFNNLIKDKYLAAGIRLLYPLVHQFPSRQRVQPLLPAVVPPLPLKI
jgi:CheY-like chemotaxis protein